MKALCEGHSASSEWSESNSKRSAWHSTVRMRASADV